jgi:hypothetical protein
MPRQYGLGGNLLTCRVATNANITLSGLQSIDAVTVAAGDRVLVKDQTAKTENGVYVAASGAWARATDVPDTATQVQGLLVYVREGTLNKYKTYQQEESNPTGNGPWWDIYVPVDAGGSFSYPPPQGAGHVYYDDTNHVLAVWNGGSWVQAGWPYVTTSTTRPSVGVYDGLVIYETDTGLAYIRQGGTWKTYGTSIPDPLVVNEVRTKKIDYNPAGSGDILMGASLNTNGNTIYGVPTPANSDWVATKGYVDGKVSNEVAIAASSPGSPGAYDLWVDTSVSAISDPTLALLANPPRAKMARNAVLSLTANVWTVVPWDVTTYNPFGMWASGSPSRLTVATAGLYHVDCATIFGVTASVLRLGVGVYLNGAFVHQNLILGPGTTGAAVGPAFSADVQCAVGDYLEMFVYSTIANTLAAGNPQFAFMNARWVCP